MELSWELSRVFCFYLSSYLCTFYFWTCSIWWTYVCYIAVFSGHVFYGMWLVL